MADKVIVQPIRRHNTDIIALMNRFDNTLNVFLGGFSKITSKSFFTVLLKSFSAWSGFILKRLKAAHD